MRLGDFTNDKIDVLNVWIQHNVYFGASVRISVNAGNLVHRDLAMNRFRIG